jgi:Rieske Fe-S protein
MAQQPDPNSTATAPQRRTVLQWLTIGICAMAALMLGIPVAGFFLGVRKRKVQWKPLGPVSRFPPGETRLATFDNPLGEPWDGMAAHNAVYVRNLGKDRRGQDQFQVFSVNCAHLGCPVTWFPQSGLFLCPCHGGVYYEDGERASGPPPRGLYHVDKRVHDGQLEIQAPHYPTLQNTLRDDSKG